MNVDKLGRHPLPTREGWGEGTAPLNKDVSTYFDQINWDKLSNAFVLKCNHGSKWQYIIKNKEEFLTTPQLFETVKRNITGWLEQEFFPWNGFEMQYKGIKPKILIEPLMRDEINTPSKEIMIYFLNGKPKITVKTHNSNEVTLWDKNLNYIDDILSEGDIKVYEKADDLLNQTIDLSNQLINNDKPLAPDGRRFNDRSNTFNFVRIDWLIYKNKPYFEEFTFTPYSGLSSSLTKKYNKELGKYICIGRINDGF